MWGHAPPGWRCRVWERWHGQRAFMRDFIYSQSGKNDQCKLGLLEGWTAAVKTIEE